MRIRHAPQPGRGLGMPIEAWPAADQQAWHAAFVPRDPFDDRADVSQMREATRTKIAVAYARWLCWLQDHHPDSLALPAAQRVTEAAVIAYLTALMAEISARGAAHYAACLRSALTIVAPDADWSWLMPIVGRLHRRAQAAPKARRPFVPTTELFVYGVDLMRAAEAAPDANPIDRAVAFRDGLMLAFLAARPLRLKNMINLEIGTQLQAIGEGYHVALAAEVMKTHAALEFPLSEALAPFMRSYLAYHRPVLASGPYGAEAGYPDHARFVWLGRHGAPHSQDSFADRLTDRIQERFNQRLTPHDFRRCAATTIAEYQPEDYRIIRAILGHATGATADKHYNRAKGIGAARVFQAAMIERRKTLTPCLGMYSVPTQSGLP